MRTTICVRVNYDLLIRPAVSDDIARSCTTHETYSGVFKVVGILLRDQLTKQKCYLVACSAHEQLILESRK